MTTTLTVGADAAAPLRPRVLDDVGRSLYGPAAGHAARYVVSDGSGTRHLMTGAAGNLLLDLLDGSRTLEDAHAELARRRVRVDRERLEQFVALCGANGLLAAGTWPEGTPVRGRSKRERLGLYGRAIKADALLDLIIEYRRWWLNPATKAAGALLLLAGVANLFLLPPGGGLLSPFRQITMTRGDALLLLLPLPLVAELALHELAHAVACRLMGARCGGFGVGLLWGLIPICYSESTDVHRIGERWRRVFVSFAGPMIDIMAFGLAMTLWHLLDPGSPLARITLAYSGLSMSAFLISLNPFLIRMDGYWMAADWLGQPNLWRVTRRYIAREIGRLRGHADADAASLEPPLDDRPATRARYVCYGIVAVAWTLGYLGAMLHESLQVAAQLVGHFGGLHGR